MATLSPIQHHHHHHHLSSSTPANVGGNSPFGDQQQSQQQDINQQQQGKGMANESAHLSGGGGGGGEEDGKSLESNSKKSGGFLKTSLLTRARNSTINLASLATVTNKFTCSASVGNLWHHGNHHNNNNHHHHHHHQHNANESVEPIEYVTSNAFDSFHPDEHQPRGPVREVIHSIKSASGTKLQSVAPSLSASSSGRKLSTKDKGKRQKEAERVEKLRLLVSYLKSGTSQPVVNPVALEADEIELAERYKLHMALRDDLLRREGGDDSNEQQSTSRKQDDKRPGEPISNKLGADKRLISHSIGGTTTTTSPASSSSSSMNHEAMAAARERTIQASPPPPPPHIGNVSWVLRHSISDPGNAYEQASPFTALPLSSAVSSHHNSSPPNGPAAKLPAVIGSYEQCQAGAACDSCGAPSSSSYSGSSINNYCMNMNGPSQHTSNNRFNLSIKQIPNNQVATTMPKLFYIDDPIDCVAAPFPASAHSSSTPNATATAATTSHQMVSNSSPISGSNHLSTSFYSQPATPAISTTSSGECLRNNSSTTSNSSAWTNPHQNLATWIDNEVNSLVHDLEEKSQKISRESKGSGKSGSKKKWLSVTSSSNPRRNSSGAQST